MEARGIKVKMVKVPIPIAFGPAFEGERIRKSDTHVEFGGGRSVAYELVRSVPPEEVHDREIVVDGPDLRGLPAGSVLPLGIVVRVAGARMQHDFESVLERRIHRIVNYGEGTMHVAQRDNHLDPRLDGSGREGILPRGPRPDALRQASTRTSRTSWTRCRCRSRPGLRMCSRG